MQVLHMYSYDIYRHLTLHEFDLRGQLRSLEVKIWYIGYFLKYLPNLNSDKNFVKKVYVKGPKNTLVPIFDGVKSKNPIRG